MSELLGSLNVELPPTPAHLEAEMHRLVFSQWDQEFLKTPAARRAIDDVVFARFHSALRHSIPWLQRCIDLAPATVVEIGCGSGSSTAALALNSGRVVGVDIDAPSVDAARARCQAYGLTNVELRGTTPAEMLDHATSVDDPDVFVLYAVLEHQTYPERLETLSTLWARLPAGGHLVVIETPNRLAYMDSHTSELPFYHLLPDDIAFAYLDRVPRQAFRETMRTALDERAADCSERRIRWGLGASYHEFELAIDEPLCDVVVADGFEDEMQAFFGIGLDEEVLTRYFLAAAPEQPIGFARSVLNLILRKPASDEDRAAARSHNAERRVAIASSIVSASAPPPEQTLDVPAPTHPTVVDRLRPYVPKPLVPVGRWAKRVLVRSRLLR